MLKIALKRRSRVTPPSPKNKTNEYDIQNQLAKQLLGLSSDKSIYRVASINLLIQKGTFSPNNALCGLGKLKGY